MADDTVQIVFAGSGGMYHYYLGIAKVLQENFYLDNVICGGTSGGCFPALLLLLGHNIDKVHYDINRKILDESANSWLGSLFRWNAIVRKHVLDFLDPDTHEKVNGRLFISMTNIRPFQNEVVSEWESTEDLVDCMQCSSFIPIVFEPKMWHYHRETRYVDGGFTNNKVTVHPDKPHIYITTNKWRTNNYNWIWCYSDYMWAEQLYMWGKEDATKNIHEFVEHLKLKEDSLLNYTETLVINDEPDAE